MIRYTPILFFYILFSCSNSTTQPEFDKKELPKSLPKLKNKTKEQDTTCAYTVNLDNDFLFVLQEKDTLLIAEKIDDYYFSIMRGMHANYSIDIFSKNGKYLYGCLLQGIEVSKNTNNIFIKKDPLLNDEILELCESIFEKNTGLLFKSRDKRITHEFEKNQSFCSRYQLKLSFKNKFFRSYIKSIIPHEEKILNGDFGKNQLNLIQKKNKNNIIEKEYYVTANNIKDSVFKSYYSDGTLKSKGFFNKGKKQGRWYIFDTHGNKKISFYYDSTEKVIITRKYFNSKGAYAEFRDGDDLTYEGVEKTDSIMNK